MVDFLPLGAQDLEKKIRELRLPCAIGEGFFIRQEALRSYLTESDVLDKLLDELEIDVRYYPGIRNNCLIVFVLLLRLRKHNEISKFSCNRYLFDNHLPFHKDDKSKWPADCHEFFDKFCEEQWEFCVEPWEQGRLAGQKFEENVRLPILAKETIRAGSNSKTFKIQLCPEYNRLDPNSDSLVLKTCSLQEEKGHYNEVSSYLILMQQRDVLPNIVSLHGHFQHRNEYNLVLEYVNGGTLENLYQSTPPNRAQILLFWTNFSKVFNPLYRMHELKFRRDRVRAIHQDIKPSNIMISRPNNSPDYNIAFKLIDFAFARFRKWNTVEDVPDFDEGGTQMYSAPELCRSSRFLQHSKLPITTDIDTWSFGAVLSETLVWCVLGKEGLDEYRSRRLQATRKNPLLQSGGYEGCFHDGERVLNVVDEMHRKALATAKNDVCTLMIIGSMVGLVDMMLAAESRASDYTLHMMFEKAIGHARTSVNLRNASEARMITPPELPPEMLQSVTHHSDQPIQPSSDARTTNLPHTRPMASDELPSSSTRPSILQQPAENGHIRNGRPTAPKVRFQTTDAVHQPPIRVSSSAHSSEHDQRPDVGKYPAVTVEDAANWIFQCKAQKKKSRMFMTANSSVLNQLSGMELQHKLKGRDQVFLFDDSASMGKHWSGPNGVLKTFEALGYLVKDCTANGLQAYFGISRTLVDGKDREKIIRMIKNTDPRRESNMKFYFKNICEHWWNQNRSWLEKGFEKSPSRSWLLSKKPNVIRGLNVYVFTDGAWQMTPGADTFCGVDLEIKKIFDKMTGCNVDLNTIGIEFIQFGNDLEGSPRLAALKERLRGLGCFKNIFDVEPSSGNIWKMLLGSFD